MKTAKAKHSKKANGTADQITIRASYAAAGYVETVNKAGEKVWVPRTTGSHIPTRNQRQRRKDARRREAAGIR